MLPTPKYDLTTFPEVYEPAEDSFLFLDALEKDSDFLKALNPQLVVEIGSGSGIVITAISFILKNNCVYYATDINYEACSATQKTAIINNSVVHPVNMNLLSCFKTKFDVILFNPPYVSTESSEMVGQGINRAWAGGHNGRKVIDQVLRDLPSLLSANGVCYMILLRENNTKDVVKLMTQNGFHSKVVLERRIPGEYLYVYKFSFNDTLANK